MFHPAIKNKLSPQFIAGAKLVARKKEVFGYKIAIHACFYSHGRVQKNNEFNLTVFVVRKGKAHHRLPPI